MVSVASVLRLMSFWIVTNDLLPRNCIACGGLTDLPDFTGWSDLSLDVPECHSG